MKEITLQSGKVIILNEQQEEVLNQMTEDWFPSPRLFFMLAGYAGTGKTSIVREFLNSVQHKSIAVSAPTHKAKKEISRATGLEGKTIQSLLGLGIDVDITDFNPEDKKFKQVRTPLIKDFKLIVIDEGSMLNKEAVKLIKDLAVQFKCKIVFMGDKAQLPPINEFESIIFSDPEIVDKYELTKVERQSGDNPIMPIYDALRNNLNSKTDPFERITKFDEETQSGIKFLQYSDFAKSVLTDFTDKHFDPLEAKILCWTNREVAIWNNALRTRIIKSLYPDRKEFKFIEIGDFLIATANRGAIVNAEEFQVECVEKVTKAFISVDNAIEELTCLEITALSDTLGYTIKFHIIDHEVQKEVDLWLLYYNDFIKSAVKDKRKWRDFFAFRDAFLLMSNIKNDYGKVISPDLDYGYAVTVHRAQGSTYDNVYVVETDLNKNRNVRERNQLKYVALSRPRKKALLLCY